ncbi:queuine tRNA-guanine transglycosylase [Cryptosporidium ubiquitum]|uniref:Queuine tRNA-guanine transglycosylase n=1 Tax=Cryptosporidium ubiquitum TaxID=857276 RepID=A0A1J4MG94_9CRYT|nr:queuine tRNA-guanine transglycosylase [Cryptosporidium ubiquitum]OII72483.1 queuine tRNA-guanine transglycosylase [Cryptosporidium ubiquitum]
MVNFKILTHNSKDARYRLGVLEIPKCFLSKYDSTIRHSDIKTTSGATDVIENLQETGVKAKSSSSNLGNIGLASIATPTFSVPTFGGLPHCILPKIESNQGENYEIASLMPEIDYLLIGHGLDLERVRRRGLVSIEKEKDEKRDDNHSGNCTCFKQSSNASKFDILEQPPPQLANKDYIRYLMFRQPLVPGVTCWNGSDGVLVHTESGRITVCIDDVIASIEHFQPAFFISPAEEAQTGQCGKNVSFRSIQRADEMLLALLEKLKRGTSDCPKEVTEVWDGGISCTGSTGKPRTKVLVNIQGAHFVNYRAAAALGVWDLCNGTGKGLRNIGFSGDKGSAEIRVDSSGKSEEASGLDQLILGVAIGGLGYSEKSSVRAECIKAVVDHIPDNKLRLISLGTGSPIELLQAVYLGMDIIECPYVYRCSLSGVALSFDLDEFLRQREIINYSNEEKKNAERFLLEFDFSNSECGMDIDKDGKATGRTMLKSFGGAKYMDLNDRRYSCDSEKLTKNSPVPHSRAYVHHLINSGEILGFSLLFMHNYWQYQGLLLSVRKAIFDGRLEDFVTWFIYTQTDLQIHPIKLPEPALETYTFDGMKGRLQKDLIRK